MPVGNKNKAIAGLGSHHIAVQTRNWDESLKFYTDIMGMDIILNDEERGLALLDIGDGSHMEIFAPKEGSPKPEDDPGHDPVTHIAFTTTDIESAVQRVRDAGMEITREITTLDLMHLNITIAFFIGPNKEVIEFFQVNNDG